MKWMYEGWVKLHRTTLDNPIWQKDPTAWRVFECLMLLCDRKTGKWSGGRFQLAELTGISSGTIYDALKRLEKAKMVTLKANTKYTDIYLCNWNEYQSNDNTNGQQQTNNKPTTNQHSNKNKELRIKKDIPNGISNIGDENSDFEEEPPTTLTKQEVGLMAELKALEPAKKNEVKEFIDYFNQRLAPLGSSDNPNKRGIYALLVLKSKAPDGSPLGLERAKAIVDVAAEDDWWQDKLTSIYTLYKYRSKFVQKIAIAVNNPKPYLDLRG